MAEASSDKASGGDSRDGPLLIGWKEYVELPDLNIHRLKIKVDTGARTSALDVARYELLDGSSGQVARLHLALNRKHPERLTVVEASVLKTIVVTASNGIREERPVIETRLRLGPVCKSIRVTITNRSGMLFRMLLGRQALAHDFVVDVSQKYLLRR